ncbi:hypothetical protein [Mastigocoleus testarum]|uniref:Uncharacterized protein n=1 Tax=Mastigocoleus testarum BC008 TaxID=371196 RepID=A0A0V7ZJM3_9CYAN|nr:hypothetical protein [Mastigocoleus testarum]KST64079.1 hypothetical protein BC008_40510 [Mastigocoleus testarum BC008]KST64789.1 hypothetical protein BC008_41485 [Mastigocoleus testarum BC008]
MGLFSPASVNVEIPDSNQSSRTYVNTGYNVTTTPSVILGSDTERVGFIIYNTETERSVVLVHDAGNGTYRTITEIPPLGTYFDDFAYTGVLKARGPSGLATINVTEFKK